ncbi:MAG TPA: SHOCT domain-containing protein [Acidimicrobiales bacterium]|nr:SHOCT domain-containing protein [Acidimicrobiales bacterium]
MLAYDYPILGLFWTMFIFFLWFAWIMLLFRVFADIFRSHDLGGWSKGLWSIFVLFAPFLGVFVYLIARGHSMAQRDVDAARSNEAEFRSYVQQAAGTGGSADEIAKLAELRDSGVLTEAEFADQKAKLLA